MPMAAQPLQEVLVCCGIRAAFRCGLALCTNALLSTAPSVRLIYPREKKPWEAQAGCFTRIPATELRARPEKAEGQQGKPSNAVRD